MEHLTAIQSDEVEVRLKGRKVLRLQASQEPVRAMISVESPLHG